MFHIYVLCRDHCIIGRGYVSEIFKSPYCSAVRCCIRYTIMSVDYHVIPNVLLRKYMVPGDKTRTRFDGNIDCVK